jgi:hypothetical protein
MFAIRSLPENNRRFAAVSMDLAGQLSNLSESLRDLLAASAA